MERDGERENRNCLCCAVLRAILVWPPSGGKRANEGGREGEQNTRMRQKTRPSSSSSSSSFPALLRSLSLLLLRSSLFVGKRTVTAL